MGGQELSWSELHPRDVALPGQPPAPSHPTGGSCTWILVLPQAGVRPPDSAGEHRVPGGVEVRLSNQKSAKACVPPKAQGAAGGREHGRRGREQGIACLGKGLLKLHCPRAHRFAETHPINSLQGCFQLQQDTFAGKCPQSESSDTPAWGQVVGEVTKAALFQTNICRGSGTVPAAAGKQLERLFAVPQRHQRPRHQWPRPLLARLEVLIHTWLTKHLSLQAGALGIDLCKGKHCPAEDGLSSETSSPETQGRETLMLPHPGPRKTQISGPTTAARLWTGRLCPQNLCNRNPSCPTEKGAQEGGREGSSSCRMLAGEEGPLARRGGEQWNPAAQHLGLAREATRPRAPPC